MESRDIAERKISVVHSMESEQTRILDKSGSCQLTDFLGERSGRDPMRIFSDIL
jgi:hypothetical protein